MTAGLIGSSTKWKFLGQHDPELELNSVQFVCCKPLGELLTTQVMDHSVYSATPSLAGLGPSPALMCPQVPRNPVKMQTQIQDPEEHLRFCIAHNLPRDSLLLILGLHFNSKPFEHGL